MIRLCLDAATSTAVLGLFRDGRELSSRRLPGARGDVLPDLLAECLAEAGLAPHQIDEVACGVGPGSFTGIRIALSTALGFAFRRGIPVRGVSSLQAALAHDSLEPHLDRPRIALLDALRGEAFACLLEASESPKAGIDGDHRLHLADLAGLPDGTVVAAEGRAPFQALLAPGWIPLSDLVSAAGIDRLASRGDCAEPVPNYLRASAPEELRAGG